MDPNKAYSYAGQVCFCPKNPTSQFQRPASKEMIINETFEQKRDKLAEEYVLGDHKNETNEDFRSSLLYEREGAIAVFKAGYDACREQMQAEIDEAKDYAWRCEKKIHDMEDDIDAAKAKSQKLLTALRYCSVDDPFAIELDGETDIGTANEWKKTAAKKTITEYEENK